MSEHWVLQVLSEDVWIVLLQLVAVDEESLVQGTGESISPALGVLLGLLQQVEQMLSLGCSILSLAEISEFLIIFLDESGLPEIEVGLGV